MTEEVKKHGGARPATRDDDMRRANAVPNVRFEPTDLQRERVRRLSRSCSPLQIAAQMGFSEAMIFRYFIDDFHQGRAELNQVLTENVVLKTALDPEADPNLRVKCALGWLNGRGGWRDKRVEVSGPQGGPIEIASLDEIRAKLESLSDDERANLSGAVDSLVVAFAPGDREPSA